MYGGEAIRKNYPEAILIFVYPPSVEELKRRLVARGTNTSEQITKRLSRYPMEKEHGDKYPYHVLNDDLDETVDAVLKIIDKFLK